MGWVNLIRFVGEPIVIKPEFGEKIGIIITLHPKQKAPQENSRPVILNTPQHSHKTTKATDL